MKYKRNRLWELAGIVHRSDLLTEGGDDAGDDKDLDAGGDEGGDEGGGEDSGGDDLFGGDDSGGDEGESGDEAGDKEEEEEEEAPAEVLSAGEIAKYGTGEFETEIDAIFMTIFDQAKGRAKVRSEKSIGYPGRMEIEESKKYSLKMLLEEADPNSEEFDLVYFTNEIARYINNYTTLLDIEGILFSKAKQFLLNQRTKEEADTFEELLARDHGLNFSQDDIYHNPLPPEAAGAKASGA